MILQLGSLKIIGLSFICIVEIFLHRHFPNTSAYVTTFLMQFLQKFVLPNFWHQSHVHTVEILYSLHPRCALLHYFTKPWMQIFWHVYVSKCSHTNQCNIDGFRIPACNATRSSPDLHILPSSQSHTILLIEILLRSWPFCRFPIIFINWRKI